jgi:hypothetical protein
VIEVTVLNRNDLQPFEGGTYGGKCPPSHPYLYDEFYAEGRWASHGVRIVSDTMVAATTYPRYPTPVDPAVESSKNYWGGIFGDYINWEVRPAALSINLVCTSNTWKAWESRSNEL